MKLFNRSQYESYIFFIQWDVITIYPYNGYIYIMHLICGFSSQKSALCIPLHGPIKMLEPYVGPIVHYAKSLTVPLATL